MNKIREQILNLNNYLATSPTEPLNNTLFVTSIELASLYNRDDLLVQLDICSLLVTHVRRWLKVRNQLDTTSNQYKLIRLQDEIDRITEVTTRQIHNLLRRQSL